MKKIAYILLAFSFLLTACNNNDTDPVDENDSTEQDETNDTNTTNDESNEDTSDDSDNTTDENDQPTESEDSTNDENQSDDTEGTDESNDSENSESGGRYSSDDAVRLVKEYLEAEGLYMEMNYLYDGKDDNGRYRVQVFEVVDNGDGESHTATYGWYLVDPETGEITDLFN